MTTAQSFKTYHITTTEDLKKFVAEIPEGDYITVDTEFMREKTYYPILCLIQVATHKTAVTIDCLADGIDISPFLEVLTNPKYKKVFHAAQQDLEIFHRYTGGKLPKMFFDSQVAGMVLGYGDAVSYENLVIKLTKGKPDKSQRFTNWAKRPLTQAQLKYALEDVTYLREIYEILHADLVAKNREAWVEEEVKRLISSETYQVNYEKLLSKIRFRSPKKVHYARAYELVRLREKIARERDRPRQTILKDDTISELAVVGPKSVKELSSLRTHLSTAMNNFSYKEAIFDAISRGEALEEGSYPIPARTTPEMSVDSGVLDLLKVLLRHKAHEYGVAEKLLALSKDLTKLARYKEKADVACLEGWRYEVFGQYALRLINGEISIYIHEGKLMIQEGSSGD